MDETIIDSPERFVHAGKLEITLAFCEYVNFFEKYIFYKKLIVNFRAMAMSIYNF